MNAYEFTGMIRFEHTVYLYALAAIPLFIVMYWLYRRWRLRALRLFGEPMLVAQLSSGISGSKPLWKFIILLLVYTSLVLALANPQLGTKLEEVKREGINIMVALDISNSMKAEDLKPNRLERAKQAISKLTEKLSNDKIGLVVFAGEAFLQLPLTNDYSAVKMFLSAVETGIIPAQGTAIGAAVKISAKALFNEEEEKKNSKKYKTMILISDGENHQDDALQAVKEANDDGIIIHTIGMGTPEGAPLPLYNSFGVQSGFRKDRTGDIVVSKLDETGLQKMAAAGGGLYVRATNTEVGLNLVLDEIGKMEKQEFGSKVFTQYEDRFQYPLFLGFLLIVVEFFLSELKTRWITNLDLFKTNKREHKP